MCVRDEREQLGECDGDDLRAAVERVIVEWALVYVRVAARVAHQLQLEERGHLRESDTTAAVPAAEERRTGTGLESGPRRGCRHQ